jgi:hypothetical protein
MSEVTIELLNRRTAIAAVRQEAARLGVDGETLLDSKQLHGRLSGLDPDEPGFTGRIREIVTEAAARLGGAPVPGPHQDRRQSPQQQAAAQEQPRQWTIDDVKRSTPAECAAALEAGLLLDLGAAPTRRR